MENNNSLHVAIILDGNRRYAKKKGLKPWEGHKLGAENVKELLKWCKELNVKELTLYSFSMDNFNRPDNEKEELFELFKKSIKKLKNDGNVDKHGIKVNFIGRLDMFPDDLHKEMKLVMEKTQNNNNFKLNFAVAYSGKSEITDSLKKIIKKLNDKEINGNDIDENLISDNLYLNSNPDILIRTGGEKRISDFLLWQNAYTELFFVDQLWPEFAKQDLINIIDEYKNRERRFGK